MDNIEDQTLRAILKYKINPSIFSKNQCGFRKGHSTQQCLLGMLEKWKRSIDSVKA